MGSMGGLVLGSYALPPGLRKLLDDVPPATTVKPASRVLSEIKHVVILMQENRSFDHYFGVMPGVRGFADSRYAKSAFTQPDSRNPAKHLLPFHADTTSTSAQALPSNSHSWQAQHGSWNDGKMNGFVTTHLSTDGTHGQYTMAYFDRADIPFHWALADAFTVCDGYHSSMLGPTWPNRLYLMSGTVDPAGEHGGPVYQNVMPSGGFTWKTYPEALTKAGVSWKVYHEQETDNIGLNVLEHFHQYRDAAKTSPLYKYGLSTSSPGQFEDDAKKDKLATVSWIIPTSADCEHPDHMPAAGADFVAGKVSALAANKDVWAKTLLIVNYDENDGLFDHVRPPTAPAGTSGEHITVDKVNAPIGLGFRVPCILVSPWTVGGYVCHDTFDHTSVLRLLEKVTGVTAPNISAWRRKTVGDLTSALGATAGTMIPRLPATAAQLKLAEEEVKKYPLPAIPGKKQKFPSVGKGTKPVR
jgi:phospholipase C